LQWAASNFLSLSHFLRMGQNIGQAPRAFRMGMFAVEVFSQSIDQSTHQFLSVL
jgi:hypothetical protein